MSSEDWKCPLLSLFCPVSCSKPTCRWYLVNPAHVDWIMLEGESVWFHCSKGFLLRVSHLHLYLPICSVGTLSRCFLYSIDIFPSFFKHFLSTFNSDIIKSRLILLFPSPSPKNQLCPQRAPIPFRNQDLETKCAHC